MNVIISWKKFVLGLICAPLGVLYLIPVMNCLVSPLTGASNCWAGISGFTWYGLPIAVIAIVMALPLIFLALTVGWVKLKQFVFAGIGIAVVQAGTLAVLDSNLDSIALFAGLTPLGAITALCFWFIAIRRNVKV